MTMNAMTHQEIANNLKLVLPGLNAALDNATNREEELERRIEDAQTVIDNSEETIKGLQQQVEATRQVMKNTEETQEQIENLIVLHVELQNSEASASHDADEAEDE